MGQFHIDGLLLVFQQRAIVQSLLQLLLAHETCDLAELVDVGTGAVVGPLALAGPRVLQRRRGILDAVQTRPQGVSTLNHRDLPEGYLP